MRADSYLRRLTQEALDLPNRPVVKECECEEVLTIVEETFEEGTKSIVLSGFSKDLRRRSSVQSLNL